ncbi:MAG TPA: hypothetical protein VFL28_00980 [bacterium]|nr:hypothetical protein [bacterium]
MLLAGPPDAGRPTESVALYDPREPVTEFAWAPTGRALACASGGRAWIVDLAGPSIRDLRVPTRVRALYHEPGLVWAPDAGRLALTTEHLGRWDVAVMGNGGNVVWRSETDELEGPMTWLRADRLLYAQASADYTARRWWVLDLDGSGPAASSGLSTSPKGWAPHSRRRHSRTAPAPC